MNIQCLVHKHVHVPHAYKHMAVAIHDMLYCTWHVCNRFYSWLSYSSPVNQVCCIAVFRQSCLDGLVARALARLAYWAASSLFFFDWTLSNSHCLALSFNMYIHDMCTMCTIAACT